MLFSLGLNSRENNIPRVKNYDVHLKENNIPRVNNYDVHLKCRH
jgi:hypothetical protein